MLKRLIFFLTSFYILLTTYYILPIHAYAQELQQPKETYLKAIVTRVVSQQTTIFHGVPTASQTLEVQLLSGPDTGKSITIVQGQDPTLPSVTTFKTSTVVIMDKMTGPDGSVTYVIADRYRLNGLVYIAIAFFILTILFAGWKGIGSILGLSVSLLVILFFIVPQILTYHHDPLLISLIGSFIILFVSTFLAHGFSKQTTIAVASTFLALLATYVFAQLAVSIAHLAGLGTEDSYLLELTPNQKIDPRGLLLGGIMIGTLGALNDITTTQVAAVFALFKANPKQKFSHLIGHGLAIGREHIASLVNTLVLAYAGTSLPIFIFIILNPQHLPYWVIINNESVSEEIVRTLAGSMGLLVAVPIATLFGAWLAPKIIRKS